MLKLPKSLIYSLIYTTKYQFAIYICSKQRVFEVLANYLSSGPYYIQSNILHLDFFLPVLPEVQPLHYRVYSGAGAKTELACVVEGYPEPMVSIFPYKDHS